MIAENPASRNKSMRTMGWGIACPSAFCHTAVGKPRRSKRLVSAIGARNQNTAGQPQRATMIPPISGPNAVARPKISVNMPTAWLRRSSG